MKSIFKRLPGFRDTAKHNATKYFCLPRASSYLRTAAFGFGNHVLCERTQTA